MSLFDKKQEANSYNSEPEKPQGSVFDQIANAEVRAASTPFPLPGNYLVCVDYVQMTKTKDSGHDLFVVEFEILESQVSERPAGTRIRWQQDIQKYRGAFSAIKTFISVLSDTPSEDIDGQAVQYVCSDKNPTNGLLIGMSAVAATNQRGETLMTKNNEPFCKCSWRNIPEEMQKQKDELREKAGFPPF
jgi:hypothetical protein